MAQVLDGLLIDVAIVVVLGAGALLLAAVAAGNLAELRDLVALARAPWAEPGEVEAGRSKVRGRVACDEPLTEPLTGEAVVAYHHAIERFEKPDTFRPPEWHGVGSLEQGVAFELVDDPAPGAATGTDGPSAAATGTDGARAAVPGTDAGSLAIDPVDHGLSEMTGRSTLAAGVRYPDGERHEFDPDDELPDAFARALADAGIEYGGTELDTVLRTIRPGDEVVVLGDVRPDDGSPVLSADDSRAFYLTADDYRRTLRAGIRAHALRAAGAGLASVAFVALAWFTV